VSALLFPLPETKPAVIRALILEDLAGFTYFPQVQHEPMEDVRNRQHAKQERRKYSGEPVTGFGGL
jgi:hypothetical protein